MLMLMMLMMLMIIIMVKKKVKEMIDHGVDDNTEVCLRLRLRLRLHIIQHAFDAKIIQGGLRWNSIITGTRKTQSQSDPSIQQHRNPLRQPVFCCC